jgi:hypothetical protein
MSIENASFLSFPKKQFWAFSEQKKKKKVFKVFYQTNTFLLDIVFYVLKTLFKLLNTTTNRL